MIDPIWNAIEVFWGRLDDLGWGALLLGISFHILRLLAVSRAWRNIIQAAYPKEPVPWRPIVGAVFAGVGVNAIIPARGGEVVRVFLAKRSIDGSTYPTIAATLILLSLFDFVVASSLVIWAGVGLLPGLAARALVRLRLGRGQPGARSHHARRHPPDPARRPPLVRRADRGLQAADRAGVRRSPRPRLLSPGRALAGARLVVPVRRRPLLPERVRAAGNDPQRAARPGLGRARFAATDHPGGIGTEQAFLLYMFSGQVSRTALLAFSVGMRLTLITVNVALGFAALLITLRTTDWRAHVAQSRQ